jgi:YidC/Oxa1 family membrane protein insertase
MFQFMPIMFTFMLARFPAGLVLYWTWNNLLTVGQQWLIMRRAAAPQGKRELAKT